ncbi:hypothetical protein EIP91_005489 [Steccherinum ochraceum]|uniref:F-box domain-containing protein n=1 Tax=Steccherinum ochraceum TaxID=92696 RepID=A0A4R0RVM0_9APHY|nr:hypothetical protein EIP91_005489 [Steccherinum ochraceum]
MPTHHSVNGPSRKRDELHLNARGSPQNTSSHTPHGKSLLYAPRLPIELVLVVISFYVKLHQEELENTKRALIAPYQWIRITHVCRLWRELALKTASLWCHVYSTQRTDPHCIWEMLSRARDLPIVARNTTEADEAVCPPGLVVILAQLPRARRAHLVLPATVCAIPAQQYPQCTHLTSLTLRASRRQERLPSLIPSSALPALQELSLSYFKLRWSHPFFRLPLVKLSVRGVIKATAFSALKNMQQLKYLDIGGAIVLDEHLVTALPAQPSRSVRLPHLERLTVSGSTRQCVLLWMHFDIPLAATVALEFKFCITQEEDLDIVCPVIAAKLSKIQAHLAPIRGLAFWTNIARYGHDHTTYFKFYIDSPLIETIQPPVMQPQFSLVVSAETFDPSNYLDHFLSRLPLSHVQALYVGELDTEAFSFRPEFCRFMAILPNLISWHVDESVDYYAEALLTERVEDTTAEQQENTEKHALQWRAPNLRTLVFDGVIRPCRDAFIDAVKAREVSGFSGMIRHNPLIPTHHWHVDYYNALDNIDTRMPQLPIELVLLIISLCAESHFQELDATRKPLNRPYSWIKLTHVCRSWRELALKTPSLWNRVYCNKATDIQCLTEMLARTQNLPLVIRVEGDLSSTPASLPLVLTHLHRAQRVYLTLPVRAYMQTAIMKNLSELPTVTSLCLSTLIPQEQVPHFLASSKMPLLQDMSLSNYTFPRANPALLRPLVRFTFRGVIKPDTIATLQQMQQLRYLDIGGAIALCKVRMKAIPRVQPRNVIELPRLEHLTISGRAVRAVYFYTHFVLQPKATVCLEFNSHETVAEEALRLIMPVIATKFTEMKARGAPVRGLAFWTEEIRRYSEDLYHFKFYTELADPAQPKNTMRLLETQAQFSIVVSHEPWLEPRHYLEHLLGRLPLADVQTPWMGNIRGVDRFKAQFIQFLKQLPNLVSWRIGLGLVNGEMDALTTQVRVEDATSTASELGPSQLEYVVPRLRTLILDSGFSSGAKFLAALQERQQFGCQLQYLSGITIMWDGVESQYDDVEVLWKIAEEDKGIKDEQATEEWDWYHPDDDGWDPALVSE